VSRTGLVERSGGHPPGRLPALDLLDGHFELLDGHRGGVSAHVGDVPLARPAFVEVVARDFGLAVLVEDDDGAGAPIDLAVLDVLAPLPQVVGRGVAALEDDVGVGGAARLLADDLVTLVSLTTPWISSKKWKDPYSSSVGI